MSQVANTVEPTVRKRDQRILLLLPVVAGLSAVMVSLQPIWTCIAIIALAIIYSVAKWPEASTLVVMFILYSNAAAVAVEFHGVPYLLGTSFPLLLLVPLIFQVVVRREKIFFPRTIQLLVLFVIVQMFGALSAVHPDLALKEVFGSVTEGACLYFLTINVVRTTESLRRAVWTLIAAGALISLAPLYQQVTGNFHSNVGGFGQVSDAAFDLAIASQYEGPVQPRLAGSIGEQNRYAQVMLMLVPLALFRLWAERERHLRLLAAIAAVLISVAVTLTFSRGAAVGFVAILLAMASMRYIQIRHLALVVVGLVALLTAFPQYGTRLAKLQGLWDLVDAEGVSGGAADGPLKSRFTEMAAAGLVFLDHPMIGVGPGMFRFHYREYAEQVGLKVLAKGRGAHSLYPGLAAEAGLAGSFLFSAIVLITLRDLIRARRKWITTHPDQANIVASFVLVLVAYLTTAIFLHFAYVRFFWLLMALAHVASRVGSESARNSSAIPQVSS